MKTQRSPLWIFATLLVLKAVVQWIAVSPAYDLQRDEYLHLDLANHLGAGYLSVPPFTAFNSLLIDYLGGGVFWVRFFPALYGALTMLLIWKMVQRLGGGWFAQVLAGLLYICSGYSRLNMLYQPNSFDVLSWTLLFWLLLKYIDEQKNVDLLWMGVVAGFGILNKYNIFFLLLGLAAALLLSPQRKIFRNKYLYFGLLLALLIISPNLLWQVRHGFPVIHHMQELTEKQLVHVNRIAFLADQLIFFLLGCFVVIAAWLGLLLHKPFRPYRVILLTYLLVMLLFTYMQAKSYYTLGLYPVLLAFGAVYWERIFTHDWTRHLRWGWLALVVIPFIFLFNAIFPVMSPQQIQVRSGKFRALGLLRWEDGKDHPLPQDFADMLGWKQLAAITLQAYELVPASARPYTLVLCSNYGAAGAVNYYNRGKMPLAVSFDADYVFWFPRMDSIQYIIKVGEAPGKDILPYVGKVLPVGQLRDSLMREDGSGAYLLSDLSAEVPGRLRKRIYEKQLQYRGMP